MTKRRVRRLTAPVFERGAVARFVKLLTDQEDLWQKWFDESAVQPLVVTYIPR